MKLQELLAWNGINLERTKLIRHNLTNEVVAENYAHGYLELYQSIQWPTRFKNCDMVISFLGTEGTNGVFQGCYQVGGFVPYDRAKLPEDFTPDSGMTPSTSVIYELTRTDLLADLKDRLVIDWGKEAINWCQNGTTEKELLSIRPAVSEISFTSYDKVLLSYEALRKIVYNKAAYKEWEEKLSAVAGVYLITDELPQGGLFVGGGHLLAVLVVDAPRLCILLRCDIRESLLYPRPPLPGPVGHLGNSERLSIRVFHIQILRDIDSIGKQVLVQKFLLVLGQPSIREEGLPHGGVGRRGFPRRLLPLRQQVLVLQIDSKVNPIPGDGVGFLPRVALIRNAPCRQHLPLGGVLSKGYRVGQHFRLPLVGRALVAL